jgi:hypothetical protein
MYYNVIIQKRDLVKDKFVLDDFVEYDHQDVELVKKYFIKPYVNQQKIYIAGGYIAYKDIYKFIIAKSDMDSKSIQRKGDSLIPANVISFYSKSRLFFDRRFTEDVTRELLSESDFYL